MSTKKNLVKPSLSRGMRDFTPQEVVSRQYLFGVIKQVYQLYGYQQLETPAIEQLSVLTGKYGDEGSKLLFQILNNGEYLADVPAEDLTKINYQRITPAITEKALRYDLTVPLARYVVMNRQHISFPFKRFQIDKVWRADRPAKGRYREFYQCDADVLGSYSLQYDAECLMMMNVVFTKLNLPRFTLQLNNRKILLAIAEVWDFQDKFQYFAQAIDKWDKIGEDGVIREIGQRGFTENQIHKVQMLFRLSGDNASKLEELNTWFNSNEMGKAGVLELFQILEHCEQNGMPEGVIRISPILARGLDYYTGSIFEASINDYPMGSIASGGRYDDLTASFGLDGVPGVGMSFGAERIFDVLTDLNLLPNATEYITAVLVLNMGEENSTIYAKVTYLLRQAGITADLYHQPAKIAKQLQYADSKKWRYALILGDDEISNNYYTLKDLKSGNQHILDNFTALVSFLNQTSIND